MSLIEAIPMSSPDLAASDLDAVMEVLKTRHLSIGPQINAFEQTFADYVGAKHAVGVNSGTSALHLAMIAADVGVDDLVITTPFSFIASANCILYERAVPIFVDVDPATGNISPQLVAEAAEDLVAGGKRAERWLPPALRDAGVPPSARLKSIIPVHVFGQPADMDAINAVADRHDLVVVEDACEGLGAEYKGRKAGSLGHTSVFGFYPNKQITTGEGGLLVTDDVRAAELYRSLRNQGRDVFDGWLDHARLGYNYRLDEMSAALGLAQLNRIEELLTARAQVADWYEECLTKIDGVHPPEVAPTTTRTAWFVYVVRFESKAVRDEVVAKLAEAAIPSRVYFSPIHLQRFYANTFGYGRGDFPITEHLGDVSLALPFSGVMTKEQVNTVCRHLEQILKAQ